MDLRRDVGGVSGIRYGLLAIPGLKSETLGAGTLMTMRMTLPDAETRKQMLATGMERGMEASYVRLETLLGA